MDGPAHKETPTVKPGEGIWNVQFAPSVPGTYKVRSWPRLSPPTGRPALMGVSRTGLVGRERDERTEIAARSALSPHWRSRMPGHDCGGGQRISGGVWQVHVKLDGEHVPGSTFTINVRRANDQELIENAKQGMLKQSATCCDTQHDVTPSTPLPPLFLGTTAASPPQGTDCGADGAFHCAFADPRTCHCNPSEPNMFDKRFCRACQKWVFDYYMHQTGVKKMEGVKDSANFKPRV